MTLKNLLYEIAKYASKNKIINYSAAGPSLYQLNMETIKDYPLLFASPTGSHNVSPNLTTYTITLYYIDRLTTGGENDVDILSNSVEGLKTIINGIKRLPGIIEIYDDYSITNFADTQRMSDKVAGAYATIVIRTTNETTCADEVSVDGDDIKLQNKGLSIDENGTYTITADAGYTALKTVNLNVNVPTGLTKIDVAEYDIKLGCSPFTEVPEIFDFSNVTNMNEMFNSCYYLQTIPLIDTSNVTEMMVMFNECSKLQTIPLIDTSNVKYMNGMFKGCSRLQTIPQLDTSNVTIMVAMFNGCSKLQTIPLIDTSNVTSMSNMFNGCSALQTIPALDTSNVTNMNQMFYGCTNLQTIPELDTSNVTDMKYMFINCKSLQTIPLIDTSNVKDMNNMFNGCTSLQTIPELDTSNVTEMSNMFSNCKSLQTIPELDTSNVTDMKYMFNGAINLISLPALNAAKVDSTAYYFGSKNLEKLTDVGGWIGLKCIWYDDRGLTKCPNLTYQSCINILNGLYDFTGNGEYPTSLQGRLKVHPNFLTTVGDEISIATEKGWVIFQ